MLAYNYPKIDFVWLTYIYKTLVEVWNIKFQRMLQNWDNAKIMANKFVKYSAIMR